MVHIDARGRPVISLRQGDGQVLAEYTVDNADNSAQLARHLLYGAGQLLVERPVVIVPPQSQPREPIWEPGKAWFDAGVGDPQASLMSDISAPSGFHNSVGGLTADAQGDVFVPESALSPGETNTLQFRTTAPEESAYSLPINIVVDPNVGSGTPNQMRALSVAYSGSDLVLRWRLFAENGQKTKVYFKPQGSPTRVLLTQMALNAGVRVLVMNSQTYSLGCGEFTLDAVITGQPTRTSVPLLTPACATTYSGSTTYGSGTILLADRFHHRDHLGSLRVAFDERGWVTARHDFYPFGREMRPGAVESARLFTGHERDAGSGLDYMLARLDASGLARMLSVDPGADVTFESPQSWNFYAYVGNSPLNYTDPTGRQSWAQTNGGKPDLKTKEGETKELTPEQARDLIHRASTAPGWNGADQSIAAVAAVGTQPPVPPGYDPRSWEGSQWDNGKYELVDPDGNTWLSHPEDEKHWRHWDITHPDGTQTSWPKNKRKPRNDNGIQQKKLNEKTQSWSDPNGDAPPFLLMMPLPGLYPGAILLPSPRPVIPFAPALAPVPALAPI